MSALSPAIVHHGLEGLVVAETRCSRVNGLRGELWVAGLSVSQLADLGDFEQALGRLWGLAGVKGGPDGLTAARVRAFEHIEGARAALRTSAPMTALRVALECLHAETPTQIMGALAVALGAWLRTQRGLSPRPPTPGLSHAEDLLQMALGAQPHQALRAQAVQRYMSAVLDHGLNASTFTARVVASTGADELSVVAAAMGALSGPLHGGAPGPVLDMLDAIGAPERSRSWLQNELQAGRRIMGMGHRVYRVRDPRAAVLEDSIEQLQAAGVGGARLDLARQVERQAEELLAERHPSRPLRANVEFATAVLLDAVGWPRESFPLLFACARAGGWLAHSAEQRATGRLMRPRARYVGEEPTG